ncbi:SulP family inorganic anion transporter [Sphaerotilus microaerophilus]|uniref:Sulfate transporter n=1 Tax=Sphaerotilus microaerophilus TaxID=2914710 RepID=A0ABM7YGU4_9BURK|nr:SulP family inorganic anion transporter [Sphaerotilus sp. FB-5]BDI03774.1 sulfate transporter [Sphaerotilus sp. FB-5]
MSSPPPAVPSATGPVVAEPAWRRRLRWLLGDWVDEVDRHSLRADLSAGLLGALLVLPQGIAFAALAGLPPQYGLYSAVLPGIVAALAGSSRHVMSGPTNANSLALASMLAPLAATGSPAYIELALAITVLVGLMQLAVGSLRLGAVANFISPAALLGFTSGAALLIAIYALRDGLEAGVPSGLGAIGTAVQLAQHITQAQPAAVAVALTACFGAVLVRWLWPRPPHMLIGLVAASLLGYGLRRSGAPLTVTGELPAVLPAWHLPQVDWSHLPELLNKALALSVIALGQSLSIAKVLAARSGQRLDVNREFRGQGLSNVVGGLFSCYLSCGSLNRSLPNLQAGARTPLAAVSSSLWLLLGVAVLAVPLAHIPRAAIAGLLLLVAWGLIDTAQWLHVVRSDRSEYAVALTTLFATLTLRLESAILLGTSLALLLHLYRSARPAMRLMGFDRGDPERRLVVLADSPAALPPCPQLQLLRMEGSIYFGAASHVNDQLHALRAAADTPRHLLVMAKSMNSIDLAGLAVWEDELRERRARGGDLYFHRPRSQVVEIWQRSGFLDRLGADHVFPDKRRALAAIHRRLDPAVCATCQIKLFWECQSDDPAASI